MPQSETVLRSERTESFSSLPCEDAHEDYTTLQTALARPLLSFSFSFSYFLLSSEVTKVAWFYSASRKLD